MDFQDLLQDAEQMTAQIDKENSGLPRLNRTINQLFETNKQKLTKTSNYMSADTNGVNASILLAGKGIDTPKLTQNIENLKAPVPQIASEADSVYEPVSTIDRYFDLEQLKEIDLKSFLKSEKEACLMSVIEETKTKTIQEIEETFSISDELEWERQKQKIMQDLLGSFNPELAISNMTTTTTINPRSASMNTTMQGRTVMTDIEMEFSKEIYLYNQKLINNEQSDLLTNFLTLVQKMNDKNIEELWHMVYFMCDLPKELSANQYERKSSKLKLHFVNQAVNYLEHCFKDLLQNTVNSNLKQAKIGGAPGTLALVTGYLRLNQSEKYYQKYEETFDDHQPLWPTIYLCLRCGDLEAARNVAVKTKKDDLVGYFEELLRHDSKQDGMRRHLNSPTETRLKLEYKSRIKRSNDIYKRAVYSYLCRLSEDEFINTILDNVDDFLWFKLNSVVFDESTNTKDSENLLFTDFQTKLSIEYGERYFVKNRNPFTYLQVLLLTAQFELAIEFLLKYDTMVVHGVHVAIALYERKLLNLNKSGNAQLISAGDADESKCLRRINISCLIKMYTRKFECTDPREALQYYYILRDLQFPTSGPGSLPSRSKRSISYFAQFVSELALETREFELLFGKLEKNAIRRPGIVDKFIPESETQSIISLVADDVENKGLVEESIKLFDLCKEHQRVLELCNKLISQIVTDVNTPNSNRDRLKSMVFSIAIRYKTEASTSLKAIQTSTMSTFYLLTDLMTFFDMFHSESWDVAYETLNKLGILPRNSMNVETNVKEFISYSEEIKRNFPDLILAAMTIISTLFSNINRTAVSNHYQNIESPLYNEKTQFLNQLKEQAKALIKFVGCIPYRLSGDINARLLQLEVMMN